MGKRCRAVRVGPIPCFGATTGILFGHCRHATSQSFWSILTLTRRGQFIATLPRALLPLQATAPGHMNPKILAPPAPLPPHSACLTVQHSPVQATESSRQGSNLRLAARHFAFQLLTARALRRRRRRRACIFISQEAK
ncbi:hypothetical protein SUGI_1035420 [Cryptomeria japonica]|nr:hypothetical protein SUGI_1035420 [Cryptomeria japonica]